MYGTLDQTQSGRWQLCFKRSLAHSQDKVWEAITDPEHLARWFPTTIEGERAAGAPLRFSFPEGQAEPNATMVYKPAAVPVQQATEAASPVDLGIQREIAVLSWEGKRHEISKRRLVIGRSKDVDVQVTDPNVSRRHAEVRQEGATYWLVDLDSTNGVEVRGKRVKRLKLEDGTRFTIGSTEIAFSRELQ